MQDIEARMFFPSDSESKLSQEASSLHWRPGQTPREFILVDEDAGVETEMYLCHSEEAAFENEIIYWAFRPYARHLGWEVQVWND